MRPYPCYPPVDSQRYVRAFRGQPPLLHRLGRFQSEGKWFGLLVDHGTVILVIHGETNRVLIDTYDTLGSRELIIAAVVGHDSYGSLLLLCRKGRPEPNGHGLRLLQTSLPRFLQGSFPSDFHSHS